jgi:hypothetical protein
MERTQSPQICLKIIQRIHMQCRLSKREERHIAGCKECGYAARLVAATRRLMGR